MAIPQRTESAWKAPGESPRFGWDWSKVLATGDTISTATNTPSGGVTVTGETKTATVNVFRVAGGTHGTPASVVTTILTVAGDTFVAEWDLTISAT